MTKRHREDNGDLQDDLKPERNSQISNLFGASSFKFLASDVVRIPEEANFDLEKEIKNKDAFIDGFLYGKIKNDISGYGLSAGELVQICWEMSNRFIWYVKRFQELDCEPKKISCEEIEIVWSTKDPNLLVGEHFVNATIEYFDPAFATMAKSSPSLVIEEGLDSFLSPFSSEKFLSEIYCKKSLVVQGNGERIKTIKNDLDDFNIEPLLQRATKMVAWMKDQRSGQMQYIDIGNPEIAFSCYKAGHSLYFNPDIDTQKKYISALAEDLRMNFGAEKDGGFGGDIEIFAVNGKHQTPWHFDAQENFTIQLQGFKKWSVKLSGLSDPITNWHPASSNLATRVDDFRIHHYSGFKMQNLECPKPDDPGIVSFILRPGSILYAPGGTWHKVEALDDQGSLSMNFSMDGSRWCDLLMSRLIPALWKSPESRKRIQISSEEQAIEALDGILTQFIENIRKLSPSDFLSRNMLKSSECFKDKDEDRPLVVDFSCEEEIPIAPVKLWRNPLSYLVRNTGKLLDDYFTYSVHQGICLTNLSSPDYSRDIRVPKILEFVMDKLINLSSSDYIETHELYKCVPKEQQALVDQLVFHLQNLGHLKSLNSSCD